MKRTCLVIVTFILIFTTVGWATPPDNRPPDNRPPNKSYNPKIVEPVGVTNTNTFNPTFNPVVSGNTFAPTVTGGSVGPIISGSPTATTGPVTVEVGPVTGGAGGAGGGGAEVTINSKYEEARQMAAIAVAISRELHFKEGAHSDRTDSRIIDMDTIIKMLETVDYEDAKRGKGSQGAVKIIDGLLRPQQVKTTSVTFHEKGKQLAKSDYRFLGFVTGIAGTNDTSMPNVVYGVGEFAMEAGATDLVHLKESATEWGDTTGYSFDLGAFVTSIIGGAGSRAIGPAGSAGAGVSGMKGGSADRGDAAFAVFVSNEHLIRVSETFQKK